MCFKEYGLGSYFWYFEEKRSISLSDGYFADRILTVFEEYKLGLIFW